MHNKPVRIGIFRGKRVERGGKRVSSYTPLNYFYNFLNMKNEQLAWEKIRKREGSYNI